VVPESNMPGYPWMARLPANAADIEAKMHALRLVGVPYSEEEIKAAKAELQGKSEMDALISYLQVLGTALKSKAN